MKCLAIIPARSGSKGLPDKNIAMVCGHPLMYYTINAAIESGCFDEIMVSTDSKVYANIAIQNGAQVPFLRSEKLAGDSTGSWDVVRDVLERYQQLGKEFDYVMLLQPTSPLRSVEDIQKAIQLIKCNKAVNVVSVTEVAHPIQWCFTLDKSMSLLEYSQSPYNQMRRQDLEKYYQENGAIYMVDAVKIRCTEYNLYSDNCIALIMPRERSLDIDEKIDLDILEACLKEIDRKEK